ncbi:hypothetical protein ISS86_03090 [Candidatus Microgenomates bacterium]|nr:hypothetical protein [Candidatus Microgenomates bacterium]
MKKKYLLIIITLIFLLILLFQAGFKRKRLRLYPSLPDLDTQGKVAKRITTISNEGGRVDWSHINNLIVFDRPGEDGYYDVWIMNPDGSDQKCLTCNKSQVPQENNGQPAWHPLGEYIVFQAQDPNLKGLPSILSKAEKRLTSPGAGVNNNLWLMDEKGERFWQLTNISEKKAVLHPHFSYDGKKLLWAELVDNEPKPVGRWLIKIANFVFENDQPHLSNIQEYQPGNMQFYETHGFSADDETVFFSGTKDDQYKNLDIYTYNLKTQQLKALTDSSLAQWDEHAQLSPDGKKIVWMSSMDIEQEIKNHKVITDYWIMNSDGSEKEQLTYFNDPKAPEYLANNIVAADASFSPDGKKIVAYIFSGKGANDGREAILIIELN